METNPIKKWRKEKGVTREALAVLLGINYWTLTRVECGQWNSITPALAQRLKGLGYPGDPNADYRAWREKLREELEEKMRRVIKEK